jgi:16S rRNA (uracil1498-N3)-methyltransferase
LTRSCVNGGGADSLLQLPVVPAGEREIDLGPASLAVLRRWAARPGEILTALDPHGAAWRVRLTALAATAHGIPFARLGRPVESRLVIDVYQALPQKERFELVLQKLTELGVTRIVPAVTQRSSTPAQRDAGQAKSHRWPAVILRAAKQCRRARLPELYPATALDEILAMAAAAELKLMLYEGEQTCTLTAAIGDLRPAHVAMLVGPEGGFAAEEVAAARAAGFLPVSLGPRILRTETAAIAGTALLQGLLGDLA